MDVHKKHIKKRLINAADVEGSSLKEESFKEGFEGGLILLGKLPILKPTGLKEFGGQYSTIAEILGSVGFINMYSRVSSA